MSPLALLELGASLAYVTSKYFLSRKSRKGWLIGCMAAVATGAVYFLHGRFILFSEEVGAFLLYAYGHYHWRERAGHQNAFQVGVFVAILVSSISILLYSYSSVGFLEFAANFIYILGTGLIVQKFRIGWGMYIVGHLMVAYIMWNSGAYIFSIFQIVSAAIALKAIVKPSA